LNTTLEQMSNVPRLHNKGQLSRPILNVYLERKGNKFFKVGAASMQGYRNKMEDAHTVALGLPTVSIRNCFLCGFVINIFLETFFKRIWCI